ncbi:MAG TPA: alpha/beta hydrolase-fold protein [Pyrinomonadaceae bacterium]|nr:alpha/beta hydrolase-fold protein [Pyrinomonadaceae bacterium]
MKTGLRLSLSLLLLGCGSVSCARTAAEQPPSSSLGFVSNGGRTAQAVDWTEARAGTPRGKVEMLTLDDREYKRKRRVWIYTPPGYSQTSAAPYRLLICFDGLSYTTDIPLPTILDNLLAADKIQPTIAIMVDNEEARLGDLANRQAFADFMSKDLLPWVHERYRNVTTDAEKTILCGYSAGGLAAAYVAWKHSDLFGNVLSQSGAFWRGNEGGTDELEWLTHQFQSSPKLKLRFYLEVGALETGKTAGGPVFIEANQRLRRVLEAKGYDVRYLEVAGARHEAVHWRAQLADGVIYLSGKQQPHTHASK